VRVLRRNDSGRQLVVGLSRATIPARRPSGLAPHGLSLVHHLAVVVDVDGMVAPILEAESKLAGELMGVGYRHDAKVLLLGSEEDANEPLLGPVLHAERCLRQALMMPGQAGFRNAGRGWGAPPGAS